MYQCGPIEHDTYFTGSVYQPSSESEYNAAYIALMDLSHFRMLIHEWLNKDTYIVPEEEPLTILDSKSYLCTLKNGKDTKNTKHIDIRVHFVINGEKCKRHKSDWFEGGLELADISTKILERMI